MHDAGYPDAFAEEARALWGDTGAWKEYEEKTKGISEKERQDAAGGLMRIFCAFGEIRNEDPSSAEAQALVKKLQDHITEHYYTCTDEILSGLGKMYGAGGAFTANIDRAAGDGAASFAGAAIAAYGKTRGR